MTKFSLRLALTSSLIGMLALYSVNLIVDNQKLQKTNRNLIEESRQLQQTFDIMKSKYAVLINSIETNQRNAGDLQETLETLKKQNEALAAELKTVQTRISSVQEEKTYLEEMLINRTKQIDILKNQGASDDPSVESSPAVRNEIREKEEELRKLNEQNKVLQEKLDRLYKTTNEKIREINVAKIALSDTVSTAQKKIEDEWNTVNLGSVTTSAMPMAQQYAEETQEVVKPAEPKNEGHVLAINNEHGFVVVDLGKVDNLSSDAVLEVRKNGVSVATLSVLEIRDVMAACNIKELQDGQRIEINDPVSILR